MGKIDGEVLESREHGALDVSCLLVPFIFAKNK